MNSASKASAHGPRGPTPRRGEEHDHAGILAVGEQAAPELGAAPAPERVGYKGQKVARLDSQVV